MKKTIVLVLMLMVALSMTVTAVTMQRFDIKKDVQTTKSILLNGVSYDNELTTGKLKTLALIRDDTFFVKGYITAKEGNKRITLNWDSKGNKYGAQLTMNTPHVLVFQVRARQVEKMPGIPAYVSYNHYLTIRYMKLTGVTWINGQGTSIVVQ